MLNSGVRYLLLISALLLTCAAWTGTAAKAEVCVCGNCPPGNLCHATGATTCTCDCFCDCGTYRITYQGTFSGDACWDGIPAHANLGHSLPSSHHRRHQ